MSLPRLVVWAVLLSPFLFLAFRYEDLADPIPLVRTLSGDVALWGRKSPLTAFRLPLIAAFMGMAIETMRVHTQSSPDSRTRDLFGKLWNVFLVTLAAKTLIQGIEFVLPAEGAAPRTSALLFGLTLFAVFSGLAGAAVIGRSIYLEKRFKLERLSTRKQLVLTSIAIAYLIAAFLPLAISRVEPPL